MSEPKECEIHGEVEHYDDGRCVSCDWDELRAKNAALQAQVDVLTKERNYWKAQTLLATKSEEEAEAERDRLRSALERVTRVHDDRCGSLKPNHPDLPGYVCDCGRDEARAALSPSAVPVEGAKDG